MDDNKYKKYIKIIIWILVILAIAFLYYKESTQENKPMKLTREEQIEYKYDELKEEYEALQEELSHTESRLDELKKEYEEANELIKILQEQLESYGIIPYEL